MLAVAHATSHYVFKIFAAAAATVFCKNLTSRKVKARSSLHFCLTKKIWIHCSAWSNLTQEIQFLEFTGGSNSTHAHSNYLRFIAFYSNKYGGSCIAVDSYMKNFWVKTELERVWGPQFSLLSRSDFWYTVTAAARKSVSKLDIYGIAPFSWKCFLTALCCHKINWLQQLTVFIPGISGSLPKLDLRI